MSYWNYSSVHPLAVSTNILNISIRGIFEKDIELSENNKII